ncbi:siderochrome-iron transporter [Kwoniella heveanensis CBS 569]|nr:siderochrome-iron transporter [Kwoniella heveanensis CBS 569]
MVNPHPAAGRADSYFESPVPQLPINDKETASIDESSIKPDKRGIASASRVLSVITKRDIHIAYGALTLLALSMAFAQYTSGTYTAYATSAFKSHSMLAAAGVVSRVFSMVAYAMVPKIVDNVGRISPMVFITLILLNALSDAMMAGCKNVQTYIGANVFSGLSGTGYEMAVQVYVAETTSIVSRAFWNVAGDSFSSIVTMYSGSEIGGHILDNWGVANGWRWGYGMWCIINVVLAIPFISILFSWHRRVRNDPNREPLPRRGNILQQLFHDYDIIGAMLFAASVALVLVPITMAKGVAAKWGKQNIGMICCGFGILFLFIGWSLPRRYRPTWLPLPRYPLIPWYTLKDRSILAMFIINMCDFMSYGSFTIYFQSFMQVAVRTSPAKASQIDNTLRIVFQVTAITVGLTMRFWTPLCKKLGMGERLFHTKWPIWIGIPLCALGIGLDINFVQHPRRSSSVASFVIAKAIYGIGRGMFQTSSQVAVQAAVKRGELAMATGIFYFAMSLGGAVGVAVAGAVWGNTLPDALRANLPAESKALATVIYGSIAKAISYDPNSEIGLAIRDSYVHTMRILAILATCLQIPMLIGMFFVKNVALTQDEQIAHGGKRIALDKPRDGENVNANLDGKNKRGLREEDSQEPEHGSSDVSEKDHDHEDKLGLRP